MHDNVTNPKELHTLGLNAELRGDASGYLEAHELFGRALELVPRDLSDNDAILLRGDIMRDDAFTHTREATRERSFIMALGHTAVAQQGLKAAMEDVSRVIVRDDQRTADSILRLPAEEYAMLKANLGTTISLLGRTAVVEKEIARRANLPEDRGDNKAIRKVFAEAHKTLQQGDNGYYLTNNALNAARFEAAFGSLAGLAWWWMRSKLALSWTKRHDLRNYTAALDTFRTRSVHLRAPDVAKESILVKP